MYCYVVSATGCGCYLLITRNNRYTSQAFVAAAGAAGVASAAAVCAGAAEEDLLALQRL